MKFNGQNISKVIFNGQQISKAMFNGVDVLGEKGLYALKDMNIKKQNHLIYVRTPFDDTNDLTQMLYTDQTQITNLFNPLFGYGYTFLLDKTTAMTNAANWQSSVMIHGVTDDNCPVNMSYTYIGGNHGCNQVRKVTVASHDKTSADLGSRWKDAGNKDWWLVKIVDATILLFLADFAISEPSGAWYYNANIGASPLTHVSGATHGADVVFSNTSLTQILPSVKNVTKTFLMDGKEAIADNTVYTNRSYLEVVVDYDIARPTLILDYMKEHIGATIQDALADASVTGDLHIKDTHRFFSNNTCEVDTVITAVNYLNAFCAGGVQSFGLDNTNRKIFQYIPRVQSVGGFNYTIPVDITASFSAPSVSSATWKDANKPPYRSTQILKDLSDNPIIGFSLGYSMQRGNTVDSTRKTKVTSRAMFFGASDRKQYPQAIYEQPVPASTVITINSFRGYYDPASIGNATVFQCHQEGDDLIVEIDYHVNVTDEALTLPVNCTGKTVSVLTSDGNINVSPTATTTITVTVADGYGSATVKIS